MDLKVWAFWGSEAEGRWPEPPDISETPKNRPGSDWFSALSQRSHLGMARAEFLLYLVLGFRVWGFGLGMSRVG